MRPSVNPEYKPHEPSSARPQAASITCSLFDQPCNFKMRIEQGPNEVSPRVASVVYTPHISVRCANVEDINQVNGLIFAVAAALQRGQPDYHPNGGTKLTCISSEVAHVFLQLSEELRSRSGAEFYYASKS